MPPAWPWSVLRIQFIFFPNWVLCVDAKVLLSHTRIEASLTAEKQMTAKKAIYYGIGVMSGTSADGVDIALVEFHPGECSIPKIRLNSFQEYPIPKKLRTRIFEAFDPQRGNVGLLCQLNFELGEFYAKTILNFLRAQKRPCSQVDFIASHGQTVYHIPRKDTRRGWKTPSTLQLGEASIIAERTGITTVADFRPRDMAAGGQGAPLVPYLDRCLFFKKGENRVLQNIGGIANVTFLGGRKEIREHDKTIAFDTGPGNMVLDEIVRRISGGKRQFDRNGRLARQGTISEKLLRRLLRHPYLKRPLPKTTGREDFGENFTAELIDTTNQLGLSDNDLLATATAFTADSITDAYCRYLFPKGPLDRVLLSGGGANNPVLVERIQKNLPKAIVQKTDAECIPCDAKEAVAFALLGYCTLRGIANTIPVVTGASCEVAMGKIIPGRIGMNFKV